MSGSLITAVNCSGEKFQTTFKNILKKPNDTEIHTSPILLLTVEYPQNGKLATKTIDFSKSNVQTVELNETTDRTDSVPYSLLQLGDSILKGSTTYETFEGSIEVDGDKLNSTFGPVIVIRNEGQAENHNADSSSSSLAKDNHCDQAFLNNLLFSPLPKSVVCTVMPKDVREKDNTFPEVTVNCDISSVKEDSRETDKLEELGGDDESVHVISDKPVICRALASLPANFLYFGKTSSKCCKGVFALKELPNKSRFGPMEGVLVNINSSFSDKHLQLIIESEGLLERLDVSNENTSNWMRYVRPAETLDDQNLNLHQTGKHLYFSAIRKILPGEELRAWYNSSYATLRNLPLLSSNKKNIKEKNSLVDQIEQHTEKDIVSNTVVKENNGSKWKCTHCLRVFKSATLFNLHVLTHAADNLEINDNCDKLLSLSSVESNNANNRIKKTFTCSHCSKTFSSNAALVIHIRTHTSTKVFDCPICREIFYNVRQFREHIPTHAVDGIFSCPHCSKNFSKYKHIRGHMRRFQCGKNFSCDQCPKRFSTLDKLKAHLLSHSDYREFSCASCGKQFKRKDKWSVHVKNMCGVRKQTTVNPARKIIESSVKYVYNCHICVRGFKRRGMLVNHLATRHPEVSPDSVPELNLPIFKDNKDYYCQYCGKIYKSSTKRKAHILKIHPGKKLPPNKNSPVPSKDNPEKNDNYSQTVGSVTKMPQGCQWCYKQYASKAKLTQHQRKKHPNQLPKSLLQPRRPGGYSLESEERDPLREAVEKVTDSDIFLSDPLELSEYELSVGDGEFIIDANTLKRAMKGDVLPSDCSPEALAELGQIIENRPDSYFKVYQGPSGISVAHPVEVWDPLSLCLSPPSSHLLPSN